MWTPLAFWTFYDRTRYIMSDSYTISYLDLSNCLQNKTDFIIK